MSTFGSPLSYYGTGISTEEIRKLRFDINKALAHLDDIAEHESEVSVLQANLAVAESDISNLETTTTTHASTLSTHQSAIDDLDSFLGNSGLTLSTVSAEAAAAYSLSVFNDSKVGDQSAFPNVSANVAWHLTDMATDISTNASDISGLTSDLSNTDGVVSGHTSSISGLTSDLSNLEANVGNVLNIPYSNIVNSLLVIEAVADAAVAGLGNVGAYPVPDSNVSTSFTYITDAIANTDANVSNNASDITGLQGDVGDTSLIGSAANLSVAVGNVSNLVAGADLVSAIETLHSEIGDAPNINIGSNLADAINLLDSSLSTLETTHENEVGDVPNLAIGSDLTAAIGILSGYFDDVFDYSQTYEITSTTISGVQTLSGWTKTDGGTGHTMNANGYVDIGKTGIYQFTLSIYFTADTADSPTDKQSIYIRNSTQSKVIGFQTIHRTVDSDFGMVCCATAPVSSGDQMIFQAYTQDAATNTIGSATYPITLGIVFVAP